LFLVGCAMTPFTETASHSMNLHGTAFGGQPPVSGSTVTLYATGSTGYGSGPSFLGGTTTDATGGFQISNATSCGDPQQVYIVATGGNPGLTAGTSNDALVLVAALGKCSSVNASTQVTINEVTTIAAAYALSGFANATSTTVSIGTSGTNVLGLQHAFQNAANIVDFTNGSARATTPAGNGTVPSNMINSLADILEPCVNSASHTSLPCGNLFDLARPSIVTGVAAPVNTWQAALDMAQYPCNNTANLYALMLGTPAFQPTLGTAVQPNDLSIGITYTAGLGNDGATAATGPWGIAADGNDNVWISGMTKTGLAELSSTGALLSPNGGWGNTALQSANFTHQVAVDLKGNIWTVDSASNGGNIYQYAPSTATTTITTPGTVALAGVAVDGSNNIWYATKSSSGTQVFGQLAYNSGTNTFATTPTVFTGSNVITAGGVYALTVDAKTGNVWGPSQGSFITNYFLAPYTSAVGSTAFGASGTNYAAAIDNSGNTWITNTIAGAGASSLYMIPHGNPTTTTPIEYVPSIIVGPTLPPPPCSYMHGCGLDGSRSITIDGNNRIFINSYTAGTIVEFDPSIGTTGGNPGTFLTTVEGNGFNAPTNTPGAAALVISGDRTTTIDAAGALWTVNGNGSQPVVQILGVAAPTVAVLAQGKYGVKP